MKRALNWAIGIAAAVLLSASASAIASPHGAFFSDAEKIDLADLQDGESRTFATGDGEFTATRDGDVVTLTFSGDPEDSRHITCSVDEDRCIVITSADGDSTKVMIMKSMDDGDLHAEDHEVFVMRGDSASAFSWTEAEDAGGIRVHTIGQAHGGAGVLRVDLVEGTLLRCPKGDATLHLDEGESIDGYYCPKHNLLMEKVDAKHHGLRHEILIHTDEKEDGNP